MDTYRENGRVRMRFLWLSIVPWSWYSYSVCRACDVLKDVEARSGIMTNSNWQHVGKFNHYISDRRS